MFIIITTNRILEVDVVNCDRDNLCIEFYNYQFMEDVFVMHYDNEEEINYVMKTIASSIRNNEEVIDVPDSDYIKSINNMNSEIKKGTKIIIEEEPDTYDGNAKKKKEFAPADETEYNDYYQF